ncbi:hypothetical protein [Nocardioides sp.]|uniref:hypothetical protein n=1 Tax=Nocardioides sp. TaxID=35761 RepID=UPI0031FF2636|nr:hypothetical protein [Nocardioides sp.]
MTSTPSSDVDQGLKRLERELRVARRWGAKATRQMHRAVVADLKAAEQRAGRAEKKVAEAEDRARTATARAEQAESELAAIRSSATWKAGRAVVALPARVKRLRRS